jgi:hypothetical protein
MLWLHRQQEQVGGLRADCGVGGIGTHLLNGNRQRAAVVACSSIYLKCVGNTLTRISTHAFLLAHSTCLTEAAAAADTAASTMGAGGSGRIVAAAEVRSKLERMGFAAADLDRCSEVCGGLRTVRACMHA